MKDDDADERLHHATGVTRLLEAHKQICIGHHASIVYNLTFETIGSTQL